MEVEALAARVRERFPDTQVARGEVTVTVAPADLQPALRFLRDDPELSLDFLSSIACTDWPDREPRFWLAYHVWSMAFHHRARVKIGLSGDEPRAPSVVSMFPTANWEEREVYDFFGVRFDGHPDLARIIMPDDWEGHPLRKDYSLGGVVTPYKGGNEIPPPDRRTY